MAPPELARDAPGPDPLEPVQVALALALRVHAQAAVVDRGDRRPRQLLHRHEPLERDQRLDPLARAVRVGHRVRVGLRARDRSLLAQRLHDGRPRVEHGHAGEALAGRLRHHAVLADHDELLEPVRAADLEVVGVVSGRDLQRARAELRLHVRVGDDPQPAADERQDRGLADQPRVARVVGMHRDRGVGQHRLRPHRGDGDRAAARGHRVVDVVERVGDLALLDLEVGDRRARAGIPVDHPVVAVDQALVVEVDEDLEHRAHVALVEREALLVVDARGPEALELLEDDPAVLLAPAPDALDERLAADLLARAALAAQELLDLRLRGDPRVVGAERPARALPEHAVVADQAVLDRAVERVAHVQDAGHVGRRDRDREVLVRRPLRLGGEEAGLEPALEDRRLGLGRLPARAFLQVAHRAGKSRPIGCPDRLRRRCLCRPAAVPAPRRRRTAAMRHGRGRVNVGGRPPCAAPRVDRARAPSEVGPRTSRDVRCPDAVDVRHYRQPRLTDVTRSRSGPSYCRRRPRAADRPTPTSPPGRPRPRRGPR